MRTCPHCGGQIAAAPIPLPPRQLELLQIIVERIDGTGTAPTYAELATEIEAASKSTVARLLRGIEARGWIRLHPRRPRAIEILHRPPMPPVQAPKFQLPPALAVH